MTALLLDLDACLGDTRPLWDDWLADTARVLELDPSSLPHDRGSAAALLDAGGSGNWRTLLERYAADRAPVYLRPDARSSAALRKLAAAGVDVGVFSDAPEELVRVALAHLGAARRVVVVEAGAGALDRALVRLGASTRVVRSRDDLVVAAG